MPASWLGTRDRVPPPWSLSNFEHLNPLSRTSPPAIDTAVYASCISTALMGFGLTNLSSVNPNYVATFIHHASFIPVETWLERLSQQLMLTPLTLSLLCHDSFNLASTLQVPKLQHFYLRLSVSNRLVSVTTRVDKGVHQAVNTTCPLFSFFRFLALAQRLYFVVIHRSLLYAIRSLVLIFISHSLPTHHEWLFK